jgi:glycosyltransferase involved in cell wall biosynthesis
MRILHVTESMGAGVATAIGQYASRNGNGGGDSHSLIARVRDDSFAQEPWLESVPHALVPTVPALVRQWLRSRREDFDVVHAHSTIAGQLTRLLPHPRARTVYSPHGLAAVHHKSRAVRSVLSVSERVLAGRTSGVAAVSASEEADIRTLTDRLRISRLPHALDVSPEVRPRQARSATVVCVGRLTHQKAPDTVLDLPERLSDHRVPASCVWVGDGDVETRSRLEQHGWTVTGWVASSEVGRLVGSAAVLLHPARYEGFSLAIVEALSHGTPVIARRIPANEEFKGVRTFASTDEAVTLVSELLVQEELWDELSHEAVDYIERSHGWEAQTRALSRLYGEEGPA